MTAETTRSVTDIQSDLDAAKKLKASLSPRTQANDKAYDGAGYLVAHYEVELMQAQKRDGTRTAGGQGGSHPHIGGK